MPIPTSTRLAALLVAACVSSAWAVPTTPADVRGISWSDPRDNYNAAQILPTGLKLGDSPDRAVEVANGVADRAASINANVVRLGVNPPTVADPNWWPTYRAAIRQLAKRGVGVILCAWEQSPDVRGNGRGQHNGRFGAGTVESYAAMWKAVHADFADEPNVIGYELLNEPFGYRRNVDGYVRDMRSLIDAMDDLRGKRILVAGIGYADDVKIIADRFPEPHVWFAYHVYPNWFGGEAGDALFSAERYANEIAEKLEGVADRTVITEFGCWGGERYDYAKPSDAQVDLNAKRHVAYLHGVADACERLKLGSIYWYADARGTGRSRDYDLFRRDGSVLDEDRMQVVRRAWRIDVK